MSKRVDIRKTAPEAIQAMLAFQKYVNETGIPFKTFELVKLRASQINGCAVCLNMHARDARKAGETEQRIYLLNAWREVEGLYTEQERAALALTEEVTRIGDHGLSEETYQNVLRHFGEKLTVALIMAVVAINGWNRLLISLQVQPE